MIGEQQHQAANPYMISTEISGEKGWVLLEGSNWVSEVRERGASRAGKGKEGWTRWLATGGGRLDGDRHALIKSAKA